MAENNDLTAEQLKRLEEILDAVEQLPEDQRAFDLETKTGEGMLETSDQAPGQSPQPEDRSENLVGRRLGNYLIDRLVGAGGMGHVYEATQENPSRTVAIKVLLASIPSALALKRFEFESQALARLRHSGIAQVYEAGTWKTPQGSVPYFVMEFIANAMTITEYSYEHELGTRRILELIIQVCDAVNHGHQRGIIHRDLKPGNILVDSSGHSRIIDFGVARATEADRDVSSIQTDAGQLVGTLLYMSPEQCEADPDDLDIRTDVYSMGVVLYEMLCGRRPHELKNIPIYEAARIIREVDPEKPSSVDSRYRGDIDVIVMKALEKDRQQRYQSLLELSDDLAAYLNDETISARPPSMIESLRRTIRRHKAAAASIMTALLVLVLAMVVIVMFAIEAFRSEEQAIIARDDARLKGYIANLVAASAAHAAGDDVVARSQMAQAMAIEPELPIELRHMKARVDDSISSYRIGHEPLLEVSWMPEGDLFAASSSGQVGLIDQDTGRFEPLSIASTPMSCFSLDDAGEPTALWVDQVGNYHVQDLRSSSPSKAWNVEGAIIDAVALPGREEMVSAGSTGHVDQWIQVHRLEDGSLRKKVSTTDPIEGRQGRVRSLAASPDGTYIVVGDSLGRVRQWDASSLEGMNLFRGQPGLVDCLAISSDSRWILSGSDSGVVQLWQVGAAEPLRSFQAHPGGVSSVALSRSADMAATAGINGVIMLWRMPDGVRLATLRGAGAPICSMRFNDDGTQLLTGTVDGLLSRWSIPASTDPMVLPGAGSRPSGLGSSADGARLLLLTREGLTMIDSLDGGFLGFLPSSTSDGVNMITPHESPDGELLMWRIEDSPNRPRSRIPLIDPWTGEEAMMLTATGGRLHSAQFTDDGRHVIAASMDMEDDSTSVISWELPDGEPVQWAGAVPGRATALASSTEASMLLVGTSRGQTWLFDMDGNQLQVRETPGDSPSCLSISSEGRLVIGHRSGAISLQSDPGSGRWLELEGHEGRVHAARFCDDGRRLVTAGEDGAVCIWDSLTGQQLLVLRSGTGPIRSIAVIPESGWIVGLRSGEPLVLWPLSGLGARSDLIDDAVRTRSSFPGAASGMDPQEASELFRKFIQSGDGATLTPWQQSLFRHQLYQQLENRPL